MTAPKADTMETRILIYAPFGQVGQGGAHVAVDLRHRQHLGRQRPVLADRRVDQDARFHGVSHGR